MSDRTEVLAANRHAALVRRPDGYEVHATGADHVEAFPDTENGSDDAWDRYRALTAAARGTADPLAWAAFATGVLWLLSSLAAAYLIASSADLSQGFANLALTISRYRDVAMAAFIATAGLSIVRSMIRIGAR